MSELFKKTKETYNQWFDFNTTDGTCIRDFIHVEDVANAHINSTEYLNNENESNDFNIGSGKGYSILQIIELTKKYFNNNIDIKFRPKRFGDASRLVSSIKKLKDF